MEEVKVARIEAITSEDLVYQVTLTDITRGRETESVWTGMVPPRRPLDPPTLFEPTRIDKTSSGAIEFINPRCRFTAANGRLSYGYGLICYDFRTNNTERTDTSGRPRQRMNNVRRIESAELTFAVSAIAGRQTAFYIACLPKINLASLRGVLVPSPTELGMNYFLGYNEIYRDASGGLVGRAPRGSGNINPACIAGLATNRLGIVEPFIFTDRDSYPATVTVKLRPRMLRALERAMRNGDIFGLAAVPLFGFGDALSQFTPGTGQGFWNGTTVLRRDITSGIQIRSGLNASFNPPVLRYKYTFNNNKINTGAGTSRISTSGFMEGNMFSGTNSGFSE